LYAPIYSLYYPTAKWELTKENTEFLDSYVIQKIQKPNPPNLIIYIEGHTDDVGDSDYNMQLSQKRAQTVADFIKNRGVDESNIKISWHGKSQPETRKIAISKKIKDIRYANRRVTIRIEKL
jgi:outer membrane protein OmpA-like peptidoglycan-associated protein